MHNLLMLIQKRNKKYKHEITLLKVESIMDIYEIYIEI